MTILVGDVRAVLPTLPDGSVQCVVTSPPFYQLRDYGVDGQLGLEPTVEEYVAAMVAVFREVRRVLRDDGTLWLNLGDSYAHGGNGSRDPERWPKQSRNDHRVEHAKKLTDFKPKDLIGIPWRVAFALQADGWYLRSDIIWSKPNPMPESVTDRPTKSHEYVFLLSKRATYFYDADAVREPHADVPHNRGSWRIGDAQRDPATRTDGMSREAFHNPAGRNRRSVWTIATEPYPEAHFATFPEKLVEPCILAGTSEKGACRVCGAPWVRVTESRRMLADDGKTCIRCNKNHGAPRVGSEHRAAQQTKDRFVCVEDVTTGWRPSCTCPDAGEPVPCVVLDPFLGSGTVGAVAERLGRKWIGIELSEAYAELARKRTAQRGLFAWAGD